MFVKGKYCIINGEVKPASNFHDNFIISGKSIYEVVRIYNRKPIFFERHLKRLFQSAKITLIDCPQKERLRSALEELIAVSEQNVGNIEIVVNNKNSWSIRFIPHHYPISDDYMYGVKTMFYEATRTTPNAKIKLLDLRSAVQNFLRKNNLYEAIYINNDEILEGSRSNIFFVYDQYFLTPPTQSVLPGITRQVVIELIKKAGYHFEEKTIQKSEATNFAAAFLTGTSPGVLPIKYINNIEFNVNTESMRHIMQLYANAL